MSGAGPFSPRAVAVLVVALIVIGATSIMLLKGGSGPADTSRTIGGNSYSRSAVGYRGLFEVLQQRYGLSVRRSQNDADSRPGDHGVLVLAEPAQGGSVEALRAKAQAAPRTLVILPKWQVYPRRDRGDWAGAAQLLPELFPQSVLSAFADKGKIVRGQATGLTNALEHSPAITGPMQLIMDSTMTALVANDDGILLGEIRDDSRRVWILADPDALENHGIGRADNAAFALDIVDALRNGDGPIVFDETIHGFTPAAPPRLMRLFEFPYVLIVVLAAVAVLLLMWAAAWRFGVPRPVAARDTRGKRSLIENAAALIDFGGHQAVLLQRYAQVTMRDTARLLRAPRGLDDVQLRAWLDRAAQGRGITTRWTDILDDVAAAQPSELPRLFRDVRAIHAWKKEMQNAAFRR
jgi:hypothetical protein